MGSRAVGIRLLGGLPALVALGVGCSVLVDGNLDSVRCAAEGAVGPPACPEGAQCRGGVCVDAEAGASKLGEACQSHRDCGVREFCLDFSLLDDQNNQRNRRRASVCARPCCSSSDCDPRSDAVCWIPDQGRGGFCRLGKDVDRPEVGKLPAGAPCSDSSECRSGLCVDDVCVDSCCSDADCTAGTSCQPTTDLLASGETRACQPIDRTDGRR